MRNIWQDLRYALRSLYRNPGFSLALIGILGLGISGVTVMFTLVQSVILNQLPLNGSDRLVSLSGAAAPPDGDALKWWSRNEAFTSLCQYRSGGVNLADENSPVRVSAAVISASFFSVFDVRPQQGRPFQADDETPGGNRSVIVSHRFRGSHFGQDDKVIGATIRLNGIAHTIIGVMPADFSYPGHTDIWIPKAAGETSLELGSDEQNEGELPSALRFRMIGLLRPGVSVAQAQAQLNALFTRLREVSAKAGLNPGDGVKVTPLRDLFIRDFKAVFWMLLAGVGFLLLIACANATNLMLVRAMRRRKEIAARLCLGAGTLRVALQPVTEGILVAAFGGAVGVLLSFWLLDVIRAVWAGVIPRLSEAQTSIPVLVVTIAVSLLLGLMIGLVPAWMSRSINLVETLKEGGSRTSVGLDRRVRNALVVAEIALTMVLLVGAGLTIQSYDRLTDISPGFEPGQVLTVSLALPKEKYIVRHSDQEPVRKFPAADFHQRLQEEMMKVPGVVAAGSVNHLPLSNPGSSTWVDVPESPGGMAAFSCINGDYFKAMGIRLVSGRVFTDSDSETGPRVVIINERFARQFWPGKIPAGQLLKIPGESVSREIIGVVNDVRQTGLVKEPEPQLYLPYAQPLREQSPPLSMSVVIRTNTDPQKLVGAIRSRVSAVDKDLPVFQIRTMSEVVSASVSSWRFRGILSGSFALLALILALTGVYSVVSYSVAARIHEISVRLCLGATPQRILLMVLREGVMLSALGVVTGAVAAFGLQRYFASLLYGISPADRVTLLGSSATIITGVLLACLIPALSASRLDPASSLRSE